MKKLIFALAALGITASLGAYAALPTNAQPFQVIVPDLKAGFDFTLEGLYLQPTDSDLQYATLNPSVGNLTTASANPDYGLGFRVGTGYTFKDSGNDVRLNWTHFNNSSDDSVTGNITDPIAASSASTTTKFKYDAIDLDFGQFVSIGTRLQTHWFTGVRFARLEEDVNNTYSASLPPIQQVVGLDSDPSKFTGLGPRFGVDASYHLSKCFGFVGHFATSLLVGNVKSNASTNGVAVNAGDASNHRVVPAFDGKLGFDYTKPLQRGSNFTMEAGYQVTQYLNAVDHYTVNGSAVTNTTSNIGFNGPYLSLNYKM